MALGGQWNNTDHRSCQEAVPWCSSFLLWFFLVLPLVVQPLSRVRFFVTPWTAARQASLSITTSQSLLKLMSIESVMPCNHLILCHPLLLLPSIFPGIRVFSSELGLPIRWPKYCTYSFSISPSNESSGLTSFRIDWFDLLAVRGTLKSLLQHHNSSDIKCCNLKHRVNQTLNLLKLWIMLEN